MKRFAVAISSPPWRRVSKFFQPCTHRMLSLECDLWVFPCQDEWSYQVPSPAVTTVHDLMHRYEPGFPEVGKGRELKRREKHFTNISRFSKWFMVDSGLGKKHLMDSYNVSGKHIFELPYIPPGYVFESTPETPENFTSLPEKFFLYPAQFWKHKNHILLIEALNALKPELPYVHLVLTGSKKNGYTAAAELVEKLNLSSNVHFLGYVPDGFLPVLYRKARALIMPTFFGPTNIPPLEAMALGCPVAVSDIYAMPEQLGNAAIYFDPSSLESIKNAMSRLWKNDKLCKTLKENGLKRSAEWSQPHFNARFQSIIEHITKNNFEG